MNDQIAQQILNELRYIKTAQQDQAKHLQTIASSLIRIANKS